LRGAFVKDFNRLAPRQLLRVIDLAEVEHTPLHEILIFAADFADKCCDYNGNTSCADSRN
jgi:hypothetical protein